MTLCLLCGVASFVACSNDNEPESGNIIYDFNPINLIVFVEDAEGNDLLNPATPGSIAEQGIVAFYQDIAYRKDSVVKQTKDYYARFMGLQTGVNESGRYYLTVGEFDGSENVQDAKVTIDWNDGTKDELSYSNKITYNQKGEATVDRAFYLNGAQHGDQVYPSHVYVLQKGGN